MVARVTVQRAVRVRVLEEVHDGAAEGLQGPSWRVVLGLQNVQADLPSLKMNVGVEALGKHLHLGRLDGVVLSDYKIELKPTLGEWRIWWSFDVANPLVKIVINRRKQDVLVLTL